MILLDTTYVENTEPVESTILKQKKEVQDSIMIDGRAATTVSGAQKILTARAKTLGFNREYSRDAVYRLLIDQKLHAIRTPSANYYFVDELEKVPINPGVGRPPHSSYPQEIKQEAVKLHLQGWSQRAIAEKLGVRFQTIGYWIRVSKRVS